MSTDWLFWIGGTVAGGSALALAGWALFADRARGRRRCPKCWYDMSGTEGLRCPECGRIAGSERKLFKTRRQWKWLMTGFIPFLAGVFLAIQPKVQRDGWGSVLPSTVLILCLRLDDNAWAFTALDRRTTMYVEHPNFTSKVPTRDLEGLFDWQWRIVGDTCVDLLRRDLTFSQKRLAIMWVSTAMDNLAYEAAEHLHRAQIKMLSDSDPRIRQYAAVYCVDDRAPEFSISAIRPLLHDPDQRARLGAVTGLRLLATYCDAPFEVLVELLRHDDWKVRQMSVAALGAMAQYGHAPGKTFEVVESVYNADPHTEVRATSLGALCKFPSRRGRAMELVRAALRHEEARIRLEALWQLSSMDSFGDALDLDAALDCLEDEDGEVRKEAAHLLRNRVQSSLMRPYMERLTMLKTSEDEFVRAAAGFHLARLREAEE